LSEADCTFPPSILGLSSRADFLYETEDEEFVTYDQLLELLKESDSKGVGSIPQKTPQVLPDFLTAKDYARLKGEDPERFRKKLERLAQAYPDIRVEVEGDGGRRRGEAKVQYRTADVEKWLQDKAKDRP
jgi:hypothetical protein